LAGTWSGGGSVTSCSDTDCPAGQIATKDSAETITDGCTNCEAGEYYSLGGNWLSCGTANCSSGQVAFKVAAEHSTDCIDCAVG